MISNKYDNSVKMTEKLPQKKELSALARRALLEAEERRKVKKLKNREQQKEYGGRGGADPARFGDWEIDGRAIDF